MADTRLPFKVVKGPEGNIIIREIDEGCVYFTTDTKKIYLDTDTERLAMGGNTGIYYANSQQSADDLEYYFPVSEIEDEKTPNVKDLILNSDGCFYKVEEIIYDDETIVRASKLTIAGSGGGGGSGTVNLSKIDLQLVPKELNNSYKTILAGKPFLLKFKFHAQNSEGESTGNGSYEIKINGVVKKTGTAIDGDNEVDIGSFFNIIGDYKVEIKCYGQITGNNGQDVETYVTKKFHIKSTFFTVEWNYDDKKINYLSKDFKTNWNISVESSSLTSYVVIDEKYTLTLSENNLTIPKEEFQGLSLTHGAHKFELHVEAFIGDDLEITKSDPIIKNIMFWDDISGKDLGYIVNCNYFETQIQQYNTIQIPVMIYHPDNSAGLATITFNVNGNYKTHLSNCKNLEYYTFAYTPEESGFVDLSFSCGTTEEHLSIEVSSLELGVEEVADYEFKFKATDFANNDEVKAWVCGPNKNQIEFSENFDWINGGLKSGTDDVGPYFKVQAGSYMDIPYKMFSSNLKDSGACFKMIFKASNCRDYDAIVAECMNNNRGVLLKAQGSEIKSLSNSLTARYCEDTYIEYEFDVCKYSDKKEDQYLTIWIDGIPAGVTSFSDDSFQQENPKYLRIGSDDCDVFIYLIKFYKKHLDSSGHLANFIMDSPNSTEMVSRFNRNNITKADRYGNIYIAPELLAEKNPECNVYIYELPSIPTKKLKEKDGQYVTGSFLYYKGSKDNVIQSFDEVKVGAQGTSSMTYGISAFNLDTKFPSKWALDEEAIPVNYFNTKVNVASCEGANNALNQEWYNKYQPYKTQKRIKNSKARDTMEFKNGVVFIKDNNPNTNNADALKNNVFKEIPGYTNNLPETSYPRMYSIGNMGNSKKNADVFHGEGNLFECCIENTDNNTDAQRMITIGGFYPEDKTLGIPEHEVGLNLSDDLFDENGFVKKDVTDWGKTYDQVLANAGLPEENCWVDNKTLWRNSLIGEGFFEFRYALDEDDFSASEEFANYDELQWDLSNRFLRLVRWLSKNNPSQATNEELPEPVKFDPYKVKGVSNIYDNYNPDDEVLKGVEVSFNKTFTHDTSEYRVAKMLQESENYLILDSIIYHYLFIERHTMVDNVAKNTFWNTEDGIHWELTKDYDNDTADGVNNSGNLVFDYGIEIMDNTTTGADIFNARPSAWLHFAHGLIPLQEKMYQNLAAKGAWQAATYLQMFENWQSMIPEICWIEDFNRKYFRPNNVYGDSSYLSRLANGKKTHQRKQFEVYQEQYMDSKYKTNTWGSLIQWRSKQPNDEDGSLGIKDAEGNYKISARVKMYAGGYFSAAIASQAGSPDAINIHQRLKKGDEYIFSKEQGTPFGDATCYIYSPMLYQEFTETEGLYPEEIAAKSASKLRKLTYIPKIDKQKSILKKSLNFSSNIEEIIFQNCLEVTNETGGVDSISLDLSECKRLKVLNTLGSSLFTSYTIADGAPLEKFLIESPTAVTLSNLKYLKYTDEENSEELFKIANYGRLGRIQINNIDSAGIDDANNVNSKNIIDNIFSTNSALKLEYNLQNVNWLFNVSDNIDTTIPLLEFLLQGSAIAGSAEDTNRRELSLTGKAKIPYSAYNKSNHLELYNKYGLKTDNDMSYPNLILDFRDSSDNQRLYTVTIINGDGEVQWSRKYKDFSTLTNNDLSISANGAIDIEKAVSKTSSVSQVFIFNSRWKCTDADGNETYISNTSLPDMYNLDLSLIKEKFATLTDITIEPDYTSNTRFYTIKFYADGEEPYYTNEEAEYNMTFDEIKADTIVIKDDSNLPLRSTYNLKGYSIAKNSNTVINTSKWRVSGDTSFYCVYEEVSVYDVDYRDYLRIENNVLRGFVKNERGEDVYKGGKIVIPSNVTSISANAFVNNRLLKDVFTNDNHFSSIGSNAFNSSTLEYFDFECIIERIEQNAFRECPFKGKHYGNMMVLPEGLTYIGSHAFNCGGSGGGAFADVINFTILVPSSVTRLGQYSFTNITDTQNMTIQIGNQNAYSNLDLNEILASETPLIGSNVTTTFPNRDITKVWLYKLGLKAEDKIDGFNKTVREIFVGNKTEDLLEFKIYPETM